MPRNYPMPNGPLVDSNGRMTVEGRAFLSEISNRTKAVNGITNLDSMTSYTNDELRDKFIELLTALQG